MQSSDTVTVRTPFGAITAHCEDDVVVAVDLLPEGRERAPVTALGRRVEQQLRRYLEDPAAGFQLPLAISGTAHQRRVWRALARIPAGQVRRYGELAAELRSSARAVGGACGRNPLPLLVPCHRVVAQGGLGGFTGHAGGPALAIKYWLLTHEGVPSTAVDGVALRSER